MDGTGLDTPEETKPVPPKYCDVGGLSRFDSPVKVSINGNESTSCNPGVKPGSSEVGHKVDPITRDHNLLMLSSVDNTVGYTVPGTGLGSAYSATANGATAHEDC